MLAAIGARIDLQTGFIGLVLEDKTDENLVCVAAPARKLKVIHSYVEH